MSSVRCDCGQVALMAINSVVDPKFILFLAFEELRSNDFWPSVGTIFLRYKMSKVPLADMSDYDQHGCLDEMFKNQAKVTPNAVAVVNVDGSMVVFITNAGFKNRVANRYFNFRLRTKNWMK